MALSHAHGIGRMHGVRCVSKHACLLSPISRWRQARCLAAALQHHINKRCRAAAPLHNASREGTQSTYVYMCYCMKCILPLAVRSNPT